MARGITTWHGFAGQTESVASLLQHCSGAMAKGQALPHILMSGPSGMGKTELAKCVATEMGVTCLGFYSSPQTKRWQLARHLALVQKPGDIVFIDEIHALKDEVQELLYPAIDRHKVPVIDEEKHRVMENEWLSIPAFTLIVASDQPGKLKNALKQRCVLRYTLGHYTEKEMAVIVSNRAAEVGVLLSPQAAKRIAAASRGVPRRARHILHSLHTVMEDEDVTVTKGMANKHLASIGIDADNLTSADRLFLTILGTRRSAVSLHDLASQIGLDEESVRNDVEPYLIRRGLVAVASRGRALTTAGTAYVKERKL